MDKPGWNFIKVKGDDSISQGQTEDSLVSSRTSRETVHSGNDLLPKICEKRMRWSAGQYFLLITSIALTIFGLLQLIFTPYDILSNLRIRMIPGFPAFEWWRVPPQEAIVSVYLFNITNSERFLNETDKYLKVEEVGPIVYREILVHKNIIFNDNGTMTYTSNRTVKYVPERNTNNLINKTIVMPNIALFFITSYLYDAPFFVRFGVNLMMRSLKTELFKTGTINDFLWNTTDPILDTSQQWAPSLVPQKNVGILNKVYEDYENNVTVYIGPNFKETEFFRIDKFEGSKYMPAQKPCEIVQGAFDDLIYNQRMRKDVTLRFFRKTLCRVANLKYKREVKRYGMKCYRYEMDPYFYDRTYPISQDCYRGTPELPNGLIDISTCYYGVSTGASNPHFLHGSEKLSESIKGLTPDIEKHTAFIDVEPNTGIPFLGSARSQLNLVIKDMKGFNAKLHKFSNIAVPLAWMEVAQESLPLKVQWLVYMQVVIIPILQNVLVTLTFASALFVLILFIRRRRTPTKYEHSAINRVLAFESEKFLKK